MWAGARGGAPRTQGRPLGLRARHGGNLHLQTMRLILPAFFFALATGAAVFACSSSDASKAAASCDGGSCTDAASDVTIINEAPVDAGPSSFSGGGGDGGTTGNGFDAGTLVVGSDAGALCLSNGITESEDNSVLQAANTIPDQSGTFCGRIDSFADVDFVRFTLPNNAQSLHFDIIASEGGLEIYTTAGGTVFPFPSQTPGDFLFTPGKDYILRFSSRTGKPMDYRLEITIE